MRCSYQFPPGRKSSASAILARVLPGDVSIVFGLHCGFLYCALNGFQLVLAGGLVLLLKQLTRFFICM
jgi:hypothetical protein